MVLTKKFYLGKVKINYLSRKVVEDIIKKCTNKMTFMKDFMILWETKRSIQQYQELCRPTLVFRDYMIKL